MERIDSLNQSILPKDRDDSFAQENELGMGNAEFAAVGKMQGKGAKTSMQPQFDLVQIHGRTVAPHERVRQESRQSRRCGGAFAGD